ncbi:MAG: PAS domain S-box protein [Pyrinomonadaceae bacterium]
MLEQAGYEVADITATGEEAVELAESLRPDLMLMDIRLKGAMDGVEAGRLIHRRADIPILFLTAHADKATRHRALEVEPFGYILKPFDEQELLLAVHLALYKHKTERRLKESEQRYRVLFDDNPTMYFTLDSEGIVTAVNRFGAEHLGYNPEELIGRPVLSVFYEEDRQAVHGHFTRSLQSPANLHTWEARKVRKDGGLLHVLETARVVVGADGHPLVLIVCEDITERKRAEEAQLRSESDYRRLFEQAHDAIVIFEPEREVVLDVNRRACELYSFTREEFIGMSVETISRNVPLGKERIKETLERGDQLNFETVQYRKDGTEMCLEINAAAIDYQGRPVILSINRDITERKRSEARLRESEDRFRDLIEHSRELICTHDLDGRILSVNRQAAENLGYAPAELLRMNVIDILTPEAAEGMGEYLETLRRDGQASGLMLVETRAGQTRMWEYYNTLRTEGVAAPVVRGMAQDVTERRLAEAALRESEQKYRQLVELSPTAIIVHSGERVVYANRAGALLHGAERAEELIGRHVLDLVHPDRRAAAQERHRKIYEEGAVTAHQEETFVKLDDTEVKVDVTCMPFVFDGKPAVQAVVTDITERKRAEDRLRRSEARNLALLNIIPDLLFRVTEDGVILDFNAPHADTLPPRDFIGKNLRAVMPEDLAEQAIGRIAEAVRTRGTQSYEYTLGKSAKARSYEARIVAADDNEVLAIVRDVTERKRAEAALHEANRRAIVTYEALLTRVTALAQMLGTARDLSTVYRAVGEFALDSTPCSGLFISLYNPERATRHAAYAWSEGEELDVSELPPMPMTGSPHSRAVETNQVIITDDFQSAIKGRPETLVGMGRNPRLSRSSLAVPMAVMGRIVGAVEVQSSEPAAFQQAHATAMLMAANLAAIAVENVRLLEQERERGEQLRQSQKMEAIGHLAGGIAHDFNNLLTVIAGYSDLTISHLEPGHALWQNVMGIKAAGERAASLTRQLLAFSRKQVLQPKVLDMNTVVANMNTMLRRLIGENIDLVTATGPSLGRVMADPGQIEQVILNLAVNARDAMPRGGKLTIELADLWVGDEYASRRFGVPPGGYVLLAVSDTGHGMSAEVCEKIFDPFFTTKEQGKGTGLGLSTVYGIVKQSGGHISASSEVGRGTVFKIYLPRVDESPDEPWSEGDTFASQAGTDTVLLVEDEAMVRRLARQVLEEFGYHVLEARDGADALGICEEHAGVIDLVLTDVVMPGMSGRELADHLVTIAPQARVLFMSGYTDEAIVHHGVLKEGTAFIEKPFTPDGLARKVREVLDGG